MGRGEGHIQQYLVKLSGRHRESSSSGALACVLDVMSQPCKTAMDEMLTLRKKQLQQMDQLEEWMKCKYDDVRNGASQSSHPQKCCASVDRDAVWSDEMQILRMDGCIFLSKVYSVYASQHHRSNYMGGQALKNHVEQLAFYLFHFLMENNLLSEKLDEGSIHPFSVNMRVNLKSAALAALFLSTKINECPISMRRLIALAGSVNGDFVLKSLMDVESDVPRQSLIKTYERHLMILHGYDAPEVSSLPFHYISEVETELCLMPSEFSKYIEIFQHLGYKLSSCCLMDEPRLVAFAVFHFGYRYLNALQRPNNWEDILELKDRKIVEILSDSMNATYLLYMDRIDRLRNCSNSTPELKKDVAFTLSHVMDQINAMKETS